MSLKKILIVTTIRKKIYTDETEMEKFVVAGGIIVNLSAFFEEEGKRAFKITFWFEECLSIFRDF